MPQYYKQGENILLLDLDFTKRLTMDYEPPLITPSVQERINAALHKHFNPPR